MTDEQLRWLHETARASGDIDTARASIAALSTSEIVSSRWTKETARAHCAAVYAGLRRGAQLCREMMAKFAAYQGQPMLAMSIRANWDPAWGVDPGAPTEAPEPHRCAGYTECRKCRANDDDERQHAAPGEPPQTRGDPRRATR